MTPKSKSIRGARIAFHSRERLGALGKFVALELVQEEALTKQTNQMGLVIHAWRKSEWELQGQIFPIASGFEMYFLPPGAKGKAVMFHTPNPHQCDDPTRGT